MNPNTPLATLLIGLIAGVIGATLVVRGLIPGLELRPLLTAPTTTNPGAAPDTLTVPGALEYDQQVIRTVQKATPAVVSIIVTKDVPIVEQYFEELPNPLGDFFGRDPFSPFRFRVPRLRERGTEKREIGGGSGFLVSADGLIVTNRHVVAQENVEYTVFTNDGTNYDATVIARDPVNDIAIIKIHGENLPFLIFGDSDQLHVGQSAIAIGNALSEFRNTVSRGVVSGLSRSIVANGAESGPEQLEEVIQTDAAINPGNSGGPLLDLAGNVIGVNVAVALGSENIGFALPSNLVQKTVESVQKNGRIIRPYLGVRYVPITPVIKESNKLPFDYGVLILRGDTPDQLAVIPGSPANKAGLAETDIILEFNGRKLDDTTSLAQLIRQKNVGDTITLKVWRSGEERTVTVTLEEMPQ